MRPKHACWCTCYDTPQLGAGGPRLQLLLEVTVALGDRGGGVRSKGGEHPEVGGCEGGFKGWELRPRDPEQAGRASDSGSGQRERD